MAGWVAGKFCRICTKCVKNGPLKNLFEEGKLIKQINEITGILLDESKELPQDICKPCEADLEKAHEFRERCISAQEYFNRVDKKEQNENINEITVKSRSANSFEIKDELPIEENHIEDICFVKEESCEPYKYDCADLDNTYNCNEDVEDKLADSKSEADVDMASDKSIRREEKALPRSKRKESMIKEEHNVEHAVDKLKLPAANRKPNDKNHTYICDQCGNNFTCKHHFIIHLRRHTGDKRFQCELCPDKFFTHSELNRHMRKHTGERPFECKHCGRRFSDFSTRIKHERTHTNERPFVCTQCAKAFTTCYILKNHMLVHTGERSFKCELCNKAFQRQTHLVVHYRSIMHQQNEEKQKQTSCRHIDDKTMLASLT